MAIGVFDATDTVMLMRSEGMKHAWWQLFVALGLSWMSWAVATPVILWLGQKYPLKVRVVWGWARHIAAYVAIGAFASAWSAGLEIWLNPWMPGTSPDPFLVMWPRRFYGQMLSAFLLYGSILLVGWLLESRERMARQEMEAARLSEQLTKAQLSALRQQMEPHFLFNTLNTIAGLVREGRNDPAVDMIAGLSELLRHALKTSSTQQVALGEELEILDKYLEIEKARLADRLRIKIEVAEQLRGARVPSLILQPVVENAVRYGIAQRVEGGTVAIGAQRRNGSLRLSVYNDGPKLPPEWEKRGGIGLQNVRERLQSLYGSAGELYVENEKGGVRVTIAMPYAEGKQEA
jgi:two-component system, LytTR family, sensor kinase